MAGAVNAAILDPEGFSPVWAEAVDRANLVPVTDPDFNLLAVNPAEGFRAEAEFFAAAPDPGPYTGFVQAIRPRPIRRLSIELEINQHHGPEDRAADEAGKAALRQRVTAELYAQRCRQARMLAERKLVVSWGIRSPARLPRQLVGGNYFAEQRRFNLSLQAQRVNFDQYLQDSEIARQFRAELHAEAERKLRSRLGLLMVADREGFWPTEAEVAAGLAAWDEGRDGEKTFPANDARKVRQKLAAQRAAAYIVAHSTLLGPPAEPTVVESL